MDILKNFDLFYFVIVPVIYFFVFLYFGALYSSSMQEINRNMVRSKAKGVDPNFFYQRNIALEQKIKRNKKRGYFVHFLLLIIHSLSIIFISTRTFYMYEYLIYSYPLIVVILSLLMLSVVYFLKGAGTIDSNPRFNDSL